MPIVSGNKAKEIEKIMEANYDQEEINKAIEKLNKEFADAPSGGLMGWICPVCGRGLSPYTSSCPCAINREITYGTGTAVPFGIQRSAEEVGSALKTLHDETVMDEVMNNEQPKNTAN